MSCLDSLLRATNKLPLRGGKWPRCKSKKRPTTFRLPGGVRGIDLVTGLSVLEPGHAGFRLEVYHDILVERAGVYVLEADGFGFLLFADLVLDLHQHFSSRELR